jgi:predicted ABC-type transport system involved in lysophospholipase L1 biosynthesis ATPase subunit
VRVDRLNEAASARYRRARIGIVFQFFICSRI